MSANQACFPIATMARVLGMSRAAYYVPGIIVRPRPMRSLTTRR